MGRVLGLLVVGFVGFVLWRFCAWVDLVVWNVVWERGGLGIYKVWGGVVAVEVDFMKNLRFFNNSLMSAC